MSVHGNIGGKDKMRYGRIGNSKKELDREIQLGPSLACQPNAPTSECLLPSLFWS